MRYILVFGTMFNMIVAARSEEEVSGEIIRELTAEEAKQYAKNLDDIPNAD